MKQAQQQITALVFSAVMLASVSGCNPRELPVVRDGLRRLDETATKEANEAIANNPALRRLDDLCTSIPRSDKFILYSKRVAHNEPLTIFYFYNSLESFEDADQRFLRYFEEKGWRTREIGSMYKAREFVSNEFRVTVQYGGMGKNANYGFSCEERQ